MTILPDAASPAVLAVNVPSPSSLLSSYGAAGLLAIVFPDTGRAGRGPPGPGYTPPGAPPRAAGSPPGRTGP